MRRVLLVWIPIAVIVVAACGGSDDEAAPVDEPASLSGSAVGAELTDGLPEVNPLEVNW